MPNMNPQADSETRHGLTTIVSSLKLYEKVSIIFLLCKKSYHGLNMMELILNTTAEVQNKLFYDWILRQQIISHSQWQDEFIESICIIQNYKIAKALGYTKEQLQCKYKLKNNLINNHVSGVRKILYNLCEELSTKSEQLIELVEENNTSKSSAADKYLEYKLLLWSVQKIISLDEDKTINLDSLIAGLKQLELNQYASDLEIVGNKTNISHMRKVRSVQNILSEYYEVIDKNNLGFCVIINEKNFPESEKFDTRWGTGKDVERLYEVFTAFGFQVHIHSDVSYDKFMSILDDYSKLIPKNHSFFVLIILSHGSENVIYTSDLVPVTMDAIEMKFQAEECPTLIGKPKIFIIQSCQGLNWQKAQIKFDESSVVAVDSPSTAVRLPVNHVIGPQRGDSVIAWSTVRGYASFRDKFNGSWYIQELCKELWRFGEVSDLVDIFTSVNNNLRSKIYNGQFMVPSLSLSIRGKIQFPALSENQAKGRQLMLERLMFEEYFKTFLSKCGQFNFAEM